MADSQFIISESVFIKKGKLACLLVVSLIAFSP